MGKIENNRLAGKSVTAAIWILIVLIFIFMIFLGIETAAKFKPEADSISSELAEMQDKMDEILDELQALRGDLNLDGKTDKADLDLMFDYIMHRPGEYPTQRMDLTQDGRIDSSDLYRLYQITKRGIGR